MISLISFDVYDITFPAVVAGRARTRKKIAHAVRNGSGVTDRNYWQFAQDTFNRDGTENWFLVV